MSGRLKSGRSSQGGASLGRLGSGRGGARSRPFWSGNDQIPATRLVSDCLGWRTGHYDVIGGLVVDGIRRRFGDDRRRNPVVGGLTGGGWFWWV
jgi:hypothetical protein